MFKKSNQQILRDVVGYSKLMKIQKTLLTKSIYILTILSSITVGILCLLGNLILLGFLNSIIAYFTIVRLRYLLEIEKFIWYLIDNDIRDVMNEIKLFNGG